MEGPPGSSVFAGAGSLHLDSLHSAQERLAEQEELEDQQRRARELELKLAKGFADFDDDDDDDDDDGNSVNSSANCIPMEISKSRHVHKNDTNGTDHARTRNPPTYVESLNHMKEAQYTDCQTNNKKSHENHTPQNHHRYRPYGDEGSNVRCSPLAAGDSHENYYCHSDYRSHPTPHLNGNKYDPKQDMLNYEQLKMMYEMRVKECQQLADQLAEIQTRGDAEADSLRARLVAATSDRDKAELSLQQSQHLLATSKHRILELEQEIGRVTERLSMAVDEKERFALELRATSLGLQEAQQRLQAMQLARTHDTDTLFKEQQDRHREETERLREDLEKARNRIVEKEKEAKALEKRCLETERSKEDLLVEKGATINRLCAELEEAQNRLVASDMKQRVQQLTTERNIAREQLKELGAKLERTAHELVLERKQLGHVRQEYEDWRETLRQIMQEAAPDALYMGNSPPSPGKLSTLKDILNRCKQQAYQLNKLTEEMNKKDKKLESCRKLESDLKARLEEQRGVEMQLNSRLAVLQKKLELLGSGSDAELLESYKHQNQLLESQVEEIRSELKQVELKYAELEMQHEKLKSDKSSRKSLEREANADLLRELERFSAQLKDSLKENGELKTLYLQVCSARDALSREIQDLRAKLSALQKENDSARDRERNTLDTLERERRQAEQWKTELEQANRRILEQQKEFTERQKEFADKLDKYIKDETSAVVKAAEPCSQCEAYVKSIGNLEAQIQQFNIKLASQDSNNTLMQDLRSKAEYFEQYILQRYQKLHQQRHVATNTDAVEVQDEQTEEREDKVQDDTFASRTDMMMKEKRIREQLAEQFTLEIKTIEMNCLKRIGELEKQNTATVSKLKALLETKAQEVEVLKKFIVSERSKITEMLESKEKEMTIIIQENRSLQEEYRNLREKTQELKQFLEKSHAKNCKLKVDLEKKNVELVAEKQKSSKALSELTEQLRSLDAKTTEIETQHDQLRDKYRNVKKTALVYKEYASKKDAHVEGELERIRAHYEGVVEKLHEKLQRVIKKRREIEVNERISKMQSDFDAVLSEVNNVT